MQRTLLIVTLILLIFGCSAHPHQKAGLCPQNNGLIQHDHLTVSTFGNLNLTKDSDTFCYNYTLQTVFQNRPGIAIAVQDLQSQYSLDQFFSIKPVRSDNFGVIPFVVRTHWKYTSWTKITFSFFAEDRSNIQAGYYQVDSGSLAGCNSGKDIHVLLPFRTSFKGKTIKTSTYLHGFEITSLRVAGSFSPFQVQIINHQVNVTGIAITVSVTTITQVQSLFISYIAYGSDVDDLFVGEYTYQTYISNSNLFHIPNFNLRESLIDFYGFNGFILNNNQNNFALTSLWNGNQFNFNTNSNFRYISFNYIFQIGASCSNCKKYPIYFNGNCVSYCPTNSNFNGKTCIVCQDIQRWNGTQCVNRCANGRVWDNKTQQCNCPSGQTWNGFACIICPNGRTWNMNTQSCQCPLSSTWNGVTCVTCTGGQIYNATTGQCQCPVGQIYNGYICSINCPPGQFYNQKIKNCSCPIGQNWNGAVCLYCYGGQTYSQALKTCICPAGNLWNGTACYDPCNGGRILDIVSQQCICPSGNWNGNACIICPDTQIWSASRQACSCKQGNWNGLACINCPTSQVWYFSTLKCGCPTSQNWNGVNCVTCGQNQNWNPVTRSCGCPLGQNWTGKQCITCSGSRLWNDTSKSCYCQNSFWNGYTCIKCSTGQTWNNVTLSCSCATGLFWNGLECRTCTGVRSWNFQLNDCICIKGNWNNLTSSCVECPENFNWNGRSCVKCDGDRVWNKDDLICQCPWGTQWNGAKCIETCPIGKIQQNGLCICPKGTSQIDGKCVNTPTCQQGFAWNGKECKLISCNSGTSYNSTCACCQVPLYQCPAGAYWDGTRCVYITNLCPSGMFWDNFTCKTNSTTKCAADQFEQQGKCISLSSKCPPSLVWNNQTLCCVPISNTCPTGSYFNGVKCIPYQSCSNGKVWNQVLSQCSCPQSGFFNGFDCVKCMQGQTYANGGCFCPEGTFTFGNNCQTQNISQCISIPNSNWNGTYCLCQSGFSTNGASCFCQGIIIGDYCERCASKPNSLYRNGICQCNTGYAQLNGRCTLRTQINVSCNVGKFYDSQLQKCLPCSDGCLSCKDCYDCQQCTPDYFLHQVSGLCVQICGDGKRYSSQCDDGNNVDGDGCSRDCKVQVGFLCYGGSPSSKDSCSKTIPKQINFENRGQSRLFGKIVLNVRINYLPKQLFDSNDNCLQNCRSVISANIVSGFSGARSINVRYIPTTSFIFSIQVDFGRQPIGQFSLEIGINQIYRTQFFSGIDISKKMVIDVNPVYLSKVDKSDKLDTLN